MLFVRKLNRYFGWLIDGKSWTTLYFGNRYYIRHSKSPLYEELLIGGTRRQNESEIYMVSSSDFVLTLVRVNIRMPTLD